MGTAATVAQLKESNEDFEWYPTTDEIIAAAAADLKYLNDEYEYTFRGSEISVLDVGAGDGRVLTSIVSQFNKSAGQYNHQRFKLYAIEKAHTHIANLPDNIAVVGTEFYEQFLGDKHVHVVFSNPPYSEYVEWVTRILSQSCAPVIYLVIPRAYRTNIPIAIALKVRDGHVKELGEFDFENADRRARAKVVLLRVLTRSEGRNTFDRLVEELLPDLQEFDARLALEEAAEKERAEEEGLTAYGEDLIPHLVAAYDRARQSVIDNYTHLSKISPTLLKTLGVDKENLLEGIRVKLCGLKTHYWTTLFSELKTLRNRLATKQRKEFLETLEVIKATDFTADNIYAVLVWVCKHASKHFDRQLCDLFVSLSDFCNVELYKSNQRVWKENDWHYLQYEEVKDVQDYAFKLGYRIVTHRSGGISNDKWFEQSFNGLTETAFNLLGDIVTVANNLGYACDDHPKNHKWSAGKKNTFMLDDGRPLVEVKAFKNRNMHLKFNDHFMLKLNTEAGRLLGWLRSKEQAAEEIATTPEERAFVMDIYGQSTRLTPQRILALEKRV